MTWIVHVGGLGWSGSGAVLDALLDTGRFLSTKGKVESVSETRLFSGRPPHTTTIAGAPGVTGLDILALWTAGSRVKDHSALSPNIRRTLVRATGEHHINHKVFRTADERSLHDEAEKTASLLRGVTEPNDRATAYIQGTYAAMRALLGHGGRHLLIDNDPGVTPATARHLRADRRVVFIAVIRDPNDQYADRRQKKELAESIPTNVLRTLRSAHRRRNELEALSALADRDQERLMIVSFERFVTDARYREEFMICLLGPTPRMLDRPARFLPEESARNVGLSVASKDRTQRAIYRRACARVHARAMTHATPIVWRRAMLSPLGQ